MIAKHRPIGACYAAMGGTAPSANAGDRAPGGRHEAPRTADEGLHHQLPCRWGHGLGVYARWSWALSQS